MTKFFAILIALLCGGLNIAQAEEACGAGCGHAKAAGAGTGTSVCRVVFVAPPGATALEAQVFAGEQGLLRNNKHEVAIRGGQPSTTRVAVDCSVFARGDKITFCAKFGESEKTRTISGAAFRSLKPAGFVRGQHEVHL